MSNYTPTTNFTTLTTQHAVINGAAFDLEYGNVSTAIASKVDQNSSVAVTFNNTLTLNPASTNTLLSAVSATSTGVGTGDGIQLQLTVGASTLTLLQTQSNYTGTPITNGLTGGVQTVLSGPGQMSLGCGNGAFMNVSANGNITIPAPTTGVALTVNAVSGGSGIVSNSAAGSSNSITAQTGNGAGYAAVSTLVTGISQLTIVSNNSGSTVVGVPTSSVGLGSPNAVPLVIAVNNVARITLGATAATATSYNFAGSLLTASATAGTNGAPPSQVAGYWNVNINGASSKIPYYAP